MASPAAPSPVDSSGLHRVAPPIVLPSEHADSSLVPSPDEAAAVTASETDRGLHIRVSDRSVVSPTTALQLPSAARTASSLTQHPYDLPKTPLPVGITRTLRRLGSARFTVDDTDRGPVVVDGVASPRLRPQLPPPLVVATEESDVATSASATSGEQVHAWQESPLVSGASARGVDAAAAVQATVVAEGGLAPELLLLPSAPASAAEAATTGSASPAASSAHPPASAPATAPVNNNSHVLSSRRRLPTAAEAARREEEAAAIAALFTVHYPTAAESLDVPAEVVPGIFLGSWASSRDGAWLAANRIRTIVNCAGKGDVSPEIVDIQSRAGVMDAHYLDMEDVEAFDARHHLVLGAW